MAAVERHNFTGTVFKIRDNISDTLSGDGARDELADVIAYVSRLEVTIDRLNGWSTYRQVSEDLKR